MLLSSSCSPPCAHFSLPCLELLTKIIPLLASTFLQHLNLSNPLSWLNPGLLPHTYHQQMDILKEKQPTKQPTNRKLSGRFLVFTDLKLSHTSVWLFSYVPSHV